MFTADVFQQASPVIYPRVITELLRLFNSSVITVYVNSAFSHCVSAHLNVSHMRRRRLPRRCLYRTSGYVESSCKLKLIKNIEGCFYIFKI